MDKLALSRICAFADSVQLAALAEKAAAGLKIALLKGPEKTMVFLQAREPVRQSRFYLGELLAAHCVVEIAGVRGAAVQMGDDLDKARAAAILDAAHTGNFPCFALIEPELLQLETARKASLAREAAEIRKTKVSFEALEDRQR
ncbi:MAG: phosphonate C-P lyase system protein PhnG [Treponema sp.]|jgi:alpha-D-ribose 1-methylphosphonate 5-triphosphate synthase subunit PhnG|nr:phosphonate C-P lyase system protein PhnG [Treponema sp.]